VRLLLVVENLHQLIGSQIADDDETWAIRRVLQTEPRLMLLGTATRRFNEIDDAGQALYEFFRLVDLPPLDVLDEIGDLWALAGGGETPRAYMRPVEILTGGNPRLIRILSEFAARTSFRELMENLVHLMDEHTEYFKHHLDSLPPTERKVFVALADRWDPGTARDIAEGARMDVSATSALLKRLEDRGAVRVVDQRGRTKVYQVAERLYNVYHLMRRRGQASARVRAAVRFMVRYYEGDRLVPAVHALVREACGLTPDRRTDHYLAYVEVLERTAPDVRARIVAETRGDLYALPDLPEGLRARLDAEANPYDAMPLEALLTVDPAALDEDAARSLESALFRRSLTDESPTLLAQLLAAEDRLVALRPDDAVTHNDRGITLANLGRFDEALAACDRALELQPDHASAHNNRVATLAHLGRFDDALAACARALELQPDNPWAHHARGVTLAGIGRFDEALAAYDRALELQPDDAEAHNNRGFTLGRLGRLDDALAAYERALELQPDSADAHCNRGVTLACLDRFDDALAAFNRALELQPDDATAHNSRGNALVDLGRLDDALHELSWLVRNPYHKVFPPGVTHIAVALAASGRTGEVYRLLNDAVFATEIEPLLVALRMDLGETVDVAQEIEDVARDIVAEIEAARAAQDEVRDTETP
jgi:tetratricopeptide (TPR) repeat protein